MTNKLVLIDSSVWILALRKSSDPSAKERVDCLLKEERAAITPIIEVELLGGANSEKEFDLLKRRFDALPQIPITQGVWEKAARLAFQLRRASKTIPHIDILIATAAIVAGIPLLHADRHFDLMAEETDLAVESLKDIIGKP